MLSFILIALVVTSATATFSHSPPLSVEGILDQALNEAWDSFKTSNQRNYTPKEDATKKSTWSLNVEKVRQHNQGVFSYKLAVNKFADMTKEEFSKTHYGLRIPKNVVSSERITSTTKPVASDTKTPKPVASPEVKTSSLLPDSVDWRTKGYVTPVKDQGNCGSCWAFSATGAMEGQLYNISKKLVPLSEQNLVDCSGSYGPDGCNGGWMNDAFRYVKGNNGIDSETSYPYKAENGTCKFKKSGVAAKVSKYTNVASGDENALKQAVAKVGPIAVAIDADGITYYSSGIYDSPDCTNDVTHAVLCVGYGTENGADYWILKNSWGNDWGEKGYFRLARNKNNMCGIASYASYPTVTK